MKELISQLNSSNVEHSIIFGVSRDTVFMKNLKKNINSLLSSSRMKMKKYAKYSMSSKRKICTERNTWA